MGHVVNIDGANIDLVLVSPDGFTDPEPVVKSLRVPIGGANGSLIMSTAYTAGVPRYAEKTVSMRWFAAPVSRVTAAADAKTVMDGLRAKCRKALVTLRCTARPGTHFNGEPQLTGGYDDKTRSCFPVLNVTGGPLWVDDAPKLQTVAASANPGTSAILTNSGDATIAVEYRCTTQLVVQTGQGSFTLQATPNYVRLHGFVLLPGDTTVAVIGSGSLDLRWVEQHL